MRTRLLLMSCFSALISLALVAPAQAEADSFPQKVSNYVSDNTANFVAALAVAIMVLLLVVCITRRRSEEKAK
jgi:hypothetical protein